MVDAAVVSVLTITSVAVTIINAFCLVVLFLCPVLKNPSVLFVANLLTTHLLQGILVIPSYTSKRWNVGSSTEKSIICDTFRFSYMVTNYGSCLTLLLIAIDRVIAVYRPYSYKNIMTRKIALYSMGVLWVYVISLCSLPFIPTDKEKCKYNPQKTWSASMLIINTFIPFLLIACSYIFIFKKIIAIRNRALSNEIRKHSFDMNTQETEDRANEISVARMSLIVIIAYIFCWGPSFFYYLLLSTCSACFDASYHDSKAEEILSFLMKYLTFFDGIIAPCIYCFKHHYFRISLHYIKGKVRQRFSSQ